MLRLIWAETGGPLVTAPVQRGFGSRLIERSARDQLGGEATVDFLPRGVVYTVTCALEDPAYSSIPTESERAPDFVSTRFLYANRHPPTDQVRGHASLENALAEFLQRRKRFQQPDAGIGDRAGQKGDAGEDHQHAHSALDVGEMAFYPGEQ